MNAPSTATRAPRHGRRLADRRRLAERGVVFSLMATAVVLVLHVSREPAGPTPDAPAVREPAAAMRVLRDDLRRRLLLATRDSLYLEVDPGASTLLLREGGLVLRTYAIRGLETGAPRTAWIPRGMPAGWTDRAWFDGKVEPAPRRPRIPVHAPEPGSGAEAPPALVPPPLEQSFPVPPAFRVRYADGLTVVVRPEGGPPGIAGWRRILVAPVGEGDSRFRDRGETVRLRITLPRPDYEHLYRVLPADVDLLVLGSPGRG